MSNIAHTDPDDHGRLFPDWMRRRQVPDRAPAPVRRDSADRLLATIGDEIARAQPAPTTPRVWTDELRRFGDNADRLQNELEQTAERLRTTLAENAVLRARVGDLESHVADLNAYWQAATDRLTAECKRVNRLLWAMESRLDSMVEYMTSTRDAARREAFAPDATNEPRPPGVEHVAKSSPAEEPDDPALARLRTPLPDPGPPAGRSAIDRLNDLHQFGRVPA